MTDPWFDQFMYEVALESARVTANRYIQTHAGRDGYHLKIRTYPHHVLRHNKIAQAFYAI